MTSAQVDPRTGFTTPEPQYAAPAVAPPVRIVDQAGRMDHHEKCRMRAAAFRATCLYPGPVGKYLSRELLSFEEFGMRLSGGGLTMQMVADILASPLPEPAVPAAPHRVRPL